MKRQHLSLERPMRATAWLIALLCLWLGTGGVLHHTEDEDVTHPSSSPHAAWHHILVSPVSEDACAACEWTQGMQTGTFVICRVVTPFVQIRPCSQIVIALLLNRTPPLRSLRAPPVFLS